jgi:hypothetical protein
VERGCDFERAGSAGGAVFVGAYARFGRTYLQGGAAMRFGTLPGVGSVGDQVSVNSWHMSRPCLADIRTACPYTTTLAEDTV